MHIDLKLRKHQRPGARALLGALAMGMLVLVLVSGVSRAWADEAPGTPAGSAPSAAGAASAPAATPTAPTMVKFSDINSGDTAWMLTSTALVLMMTIPGLAIFYAGMVRKKNVLATLMQSFAITCLVSILWWVVGYSLAFTPGSTPYL
ncbi:MAG TPA: hypothetical protein VGL28_09445, partial [Steroidobacteraceae bacterium]